MLVLDVIFKFFTEILNEGPYWHSRCIAQCANGAALDVVSDRVEHIQVVWTTLPLLDAMYHAVHPACAFTARRTLAARFFKIEVGKAFQRLHHAASFVHHDDSTRTEHRTGFRDRVVVQVGLHHDVAAYHRSGRTARDYGFDFFATTHTACQFQQFGKRRTQRYFVVARQFHVARDREYLRAAIVRLAHAQVFLWTDVQHEWHGREGFRVVDRGWFAIQAKRGRERRLEARLAFFAFQRFQQRGFFAADVRAITMVCVQLERELATHDLVAQEAGGTRLFQCIFETQVVLENFAVDIVIAHGDAHGISANRHAFDQRMGIVTNDVAVLESARFAFICIADEVFLARELARHEAPFQAGRETRAATAAQGRSLEVGDDLFRRDFLFQDTAQGRIATAVHIVLQMPVLAIQILQDQWIDMAVVE